MTELDELEKEMMSTLQKVWTTPTSSQARAAAKVARKYAREIAEKAYDKEQFLKENNLI